jgi:hypothetical protein
MGKLILLSLFLVSFAVPIRLSTRAAPHTALRRAQWITIAYVFLWAYLCVSWYPHYVSIE